MHIVVPQEDKQPELRIQANVEGKADHVAVVSSKPAAASVLSPRSLVISALACILATSAAAWILISDHQANGAVMETGASTAMSSIGPFDELGVRVSSCDPLPGDPDGEPQVIYDADALSKKWAAEARIAERAAAEKGDEKATEEARLKAEADQALAAELAAQIEAEKRSAQSVQTVVLQQAAAEDTDAEARRAATQAAQTAAEEADYQYSLTHPTAGQYRCMLAIGGELVSWVYSPDVCPEDTAGCWRGTGDVDDGEGSYFVGHNPGVLHMLIDDGFGIGDTFSVWDAEGNARSYTIDDVFVIQAGTLFDDKLQARTTLSGGESVTLQTCIDNATRYKVFVAH